MKNVSDVEAEGGAEKRRSPSLLLHQEASASEEQHGRLFKCISVYLTSYFCGTEGKQEVAR